MRMDIPKSDGGCCHCKDGQIVGQGWHERYGQPHAERNALASCVVDPEGATMYVTLEPCCHFGKQPPCVNAILEAGISRVVVGSADPNPLVSGKGIAALRVQGVAVTEGVLREECDALNRIFFHFITTKRPFVSMKYAMTMDGKIATVTGASKWITSEAARADVQQQRHRFSGIMVGVGTILADDPLLTCHMENGKIQFASSAILSCGHHCKHRWSQQQNRSDHPCDLLRRPETAGDISTGWVPSDLSGQRNGHVDLVQLMEKLGQEQLDSILLEGGGTLNWAALESGIVQQVQAYIAPKLFGGQEAKTPVEGAGVPMPSAAFRLKNSSLTHLGEDILIESEVEYPCSPEL